LFIAGTASVVGHASRHVGLPFEQTREAIENLRAVLSHTESVAGVTFVDTQHRPIYKAYVRDPDSIAGIRRALEDLPLSHDHVLYLQGDLCRRELLVEVEGLIIGD
jgi:chorismate lyase/3-hydroxybenzoate synthase